MYRLFLDCEFTELTAQAKLISLALVAEDGREFYVELLDSWRVEDCSDFVTEIVLPQLWGGKYVMPIIEARAALLTFLESFETELEIVTDAPMYDWELFCELAYDNGRCPGTSEIIQPMPQRFRLQVMGQSYLTTPFSMLGSSPECSRHDGPQDSQVLLARLLPVNTRLHST